MDLSLRELLPVITTLVGVIVGGIIAEVHMLLQGERARRRALRTLLFQLLELRFEVRARDPQSFIPMLRTYIDRQFGAEAVQTLDLTSNQNLVREIISKVASLRAKRPYLAQYEQAISAIAPHDPFIAYMLSNQPRILDLERELKLYYDSILEYPQLSADPDSSHILELAEKATLRVTYSEVLDDLASHIRFVAGKISPFAKYRAQRLVNRQDKLSLEEIEAYADKIFENILSAGT